MTMIKVIWRSILRGALQIVRRPLYWISIIVTPILIALFFIDLMEEGLPYPIPAAVVDLDQSDVSRNITRTLSGLQMVDVKYKFNSYTEARNAVAEGKIYGYFVIPRNFTHDVLSARSPQITYFSNVSFIVPGSLLYKGFKIGATLASGGVAKSVMTSAGLQPYSIVPMLMPYNSHVHAIGNPWVCYSVYLSNSFIPCSLALMILIVTVYTICHEIKRGTSIEWLRNSNGSIIIAMFGKMLPQTILFCSVGVFIQSLMFGYNHFPMNGSVWNVILGMILFVIACQSFGVFISSVAPNLRIALSICALTGILSFSLGGFSFPVENMYGAIGILSYILPIRYYFLIYIDQALNGIPLYYSRIYYAALLIFPLVSFTMLWNLKRVCKHPVYIP